jgi:2-(1,2-epoxy-1,2-dihydrophenyl)acetyl-CoA isomerase
MTEFNPVLFEIHGETALVTLNRPDARNALDVPMRDALAAAIERLRDDRSVKSVVITGAGKAFCAGGDMRAIESANLSTWEARQRIRNLHIWFQELVNLEKPVVAAVNGAAYGGGLNIALAADFILCCEDARMSASFGRLGLVPDMAGFFLLPRMVGLQRAKHLIFSAREFTAREALEMGIAFAVRPVATLLDDAMNLAHQLNSASPQALGMAKTILNQSFHLDQRALADFEGYAQATAMSTSYNAEARRRFLSKEAPLFSWQDPFGGGPKGM